LSLFNFIVIQAIIALYKVLQATKSEDENTVPAFSG